MTISDQQTRALAFLAKACRPNGASRWDEPGIVAALEKVRDRDLAEVIMATVRAATDRDCDNPGVIPSNGSHWRDSAQVAVHTPKNIPANEQCSICLLSQPAHDVRWGNDHPFDSVAAARKRKGATDVPPKDGARVLHARQAWPRSTSTV